VSRSRQHPWRDTSTRYSRWCLLFQAPRAEPIFSYDATPGKLAKTVVPISYSIELSPDVESLALPGVVIDIDVRKPTAGLTLNAVNTVFASRSRG